MSAFLTSLASIGAQAGEATNEVRAERQARQDKLRQLDANDAYLQLAKQADARQQQEFEYRKKAGDLIQFSDGRIWSVSRGKFLEDNPQTDPLTHLRSYYKTLKPDIAKKAEAQTEALTSAHLPPKELVEKSLAYVNQLNQRAETEAAEEERRQKTQISINERAKLARDSARDRQTNAFREREKLNNRVLTDHEAAIDADNRVTRMVADLNDAENAEKDPKKYPDGAGAFDMDMLSQHVALTFGAIKGGMRSKAMIDEHRNAVALLERAQRAYQSGARGSQLSPQQRRNFLKLGRIAQQAAYDKYNAIRTDVQSGAVGVPDQQQFDIQPEAEQP